MTGRLTDADRADLANARELIAVRASTIRDFTSEATATGANVVAFGRAQWQLAQLVAIIERLADEEDQADDRAGGAR